MSHSLRVLFASERPPYPFFLGGAARCAHRLLLAISLRGDAQCCAVGAADYATSSWEYPRPEDHVSLGIRDALPSPPDAVTRAGRDVPMLDCGYPVRVLGNFTSALGSLIDEFRPDVVWAQLEGAQGILRLASARGVRGLLYLHDAEFDPAELRATAALGCHIVCSSKFLARKAGRIIGRPVHVVYPASNWYFGTQGDAQGHVSMINPHNVKGIDTFLEIARRMPEQKFLLVESWKLNDEGLRALQSRLVAHPNVYFQRRVSDMREIYSRTRLLLIPSMWEEGFGMVAVEAQSCGIPVIASERGGLPESVGDGGILIRDYRNVDAWLTAIRSVLADDDAYRAWSTRALQHARSADFDPEELARRFLAVCTSPVARSSTGMLRLNSALKNLERWPLIGKLLREARR